MGHSGELTKPKQEGHTYDFYQEKFMRLSHQVPNLSEEFFVGCFVSALRDAIKYDIIAKKPISMMKAMRLARVEEENLSNIRKSFIVAFPKGGGPGSLLGPNSPTRSNVTGSSNNTTYPVNKLPHKRCRKRRRKDFVFTAMKSMWRA